MRWGSAKLRRLLPWLLVTGLAICTQGPSHGCLRGVGGGSGGEWGAGEKVRVMGRHKGSCMVKHGCWEKCHVSHTAQTAALGLFSTLSTVSLLKSVLQRLLSRGLVAETPFLYSPTWPNSKVQCTKCGCMCAEGVAAASSSVPLALVQLLKSAPSLQGSVHQLLESVHQPLELVHQQLESLHHELQTVHW